VASYIDTADTKNRPGEDPGIIFTLRLDSRMVDIDD